MKVVIIGAGVAGLGIGWRLLQAGAEVTILERAQPAAGASWAAAGMLAMTAELEEAAEAERALALRASHLWPVFAAELEAASGRSVFLSRVGALLLAADAAELAAMQARAAGDLRILDARQARIPEWRVVHARFPGMADVDQPALARIALAEEIGVPVAQMREQFGQERAGALLIEGVLEHVQHRGRVNWRLHDAGCQAAGRHARVADRAPQLGVG